MASNTMIPDYVTHQPPVADAAPTLLGLNSEQWVYVSLTVFILFMIFWVKAPRRIREALDARIADTRRALDEAQALRAEAEALLADAKRRQAATHADAQAILEHAKTEAELMVARARREADLLIERRGKMAEDKIGTAERAAVAEIRARAASTAAAAAAQLIAERHDATADRALIDRTIANLN